MPERRLNPRYTTATDARLLVGYKLVVTCIMRDLSTGGACLELTEAVMVPDSFDLITDTVCHVCQVVWRREQIMGVLFQ